MQESTPSTATDSGSGVVQPIRETPTGQSLVAYRLAAIVLFVGVLLNIVNALVDVLVLGGTAATTYIVPIVIDLALAIGLLQLRSGARLWVLVRAVLGAIAWPVLAFLSNDVTSAIVMSVMQWGYSGALVLLLTGKSKTWRLPLAVGIYVVFTLVPFGLLLLMALASLLAG